MHRKQAVQIAIKFDSSRTGMAHLIVVSTEELAKVQSLLKRSDNLFSTPQNRRLRVIEFFGVNEAATQAAAARALGITPQTINNIVKRLRGPQVVADEIRQCDALLIEKVRKSEKPSAKPGRRGTVTWEDFERAVEMTDKTLIELASIVVSDAARVAVLAVFAPKCVHETIEEFSDYGWKDARWSNVSAFDWLTAKTVDYLREGVLSMDPGGDSAESSISPVFDRFGQECTFYVLEDEQLAGALEARRKLFPSGGGFKEVSLPYEGHFFDHLDQLLCRLRERHSCIGFLPGLRELYEAARRWNDEGYDSAFHWHTDQDEPSAWRAKRTTARLYLAQSGCLHELSPTLWSQLPYAKRSKFRTLKSRPKVTVTGHDASAGTVTLLVEPMPECGYPVIIKSCDAPETVAKQHRKSLRSDSPTGRLIYSASGEDDCLIRPPFIGERPNVGASESKISATGVVLVPRHFLLPAPEVDLERLAGWVESPEILTQTIPAQKAETESDLHVMVMPEIMQGIEQAFRANRYGDAHRELWRHQERLRLQQAKFKNIVDPQRQVNLLGVDPHSGPYYYFSLSEVISQTPTLQVDERFAHRLSVLEAKQQRAEPASENLFWSGEPFEYHSYRTLLALILDFDADFLLLGLSAESARAIAARTENWSGRVRDVILRKVLCEGQAGLNVDLLWRVVRRKPEITDDKIIDCFTSTLPVFCERYAYSSRRRAVENAQRLALSRYKPEGIVVESEEAIFRSWCSYFGQRARGLLTEAGGDAREKQQQLREMVDSIRPRPSKNRLTPYNESADNADSWDDGESAQEW